MLPVQNIPEQYLYQLLPQGVINLDTRRLIEAVLGGYQDRLSDLRSYISGLNELVKPDAELPQLGFNVILVTFQGPVGQIITRSLDILPTTPDLDDTAALLAWAVDELELEDPTAIRSAVAGTDLLREIDIDSISLLASNVGAILYLGLRDDESADVARRTRQQLLQSHFPRLKIKGTADSFELLGRVLGFDAVAMTPLWSRLVPHIPNDPGSTNNDPDFHARPEQIPSAALPDPRYDPLDYRDGEFYSWASGQLSEDPDSAYFWTTAVNNRNPFLKIVRLGEVTQPPPGRYVLAGGKSNVVPSVLLDAGTVTSNIRAEALVSGASMNGLKIDVVDFYGTAVGLEVTSKLSAIKYRSSYFDLKATLKDGDVGTEPATSSLDLEANPSLTSDGTALVPFRPWSGGSNVQAVTVFPDVIIGSVTQVDGRVQVTGNDVQLARDTFNEALRVADTLESLRPATRKIRARSVGLSIREAAEFAAFPSIVTLFTASGAGTYAGTVAQADRPTTPSDILLQGWMGGSMVPTYADATETGATVAGAGFAGTFNQETSQFSVVVTSPFTAGSLVATYLALQGTMIRSEPGEAQKAAGVVARQANPEDQIDLRGSNVSLYDEMPWRRDNVLGGCPVDDDFYYPVVSDLGYKKAVLPYRALALSGRQYELAVLDAVIRVQPFRFKVLQNPEIDLITGAPLGDYNRLLLAENEDREQFHVLLIDRALVTTQFWSPARHTDIVQWVPFNEHPLDDVEPFARYTTLVDAEINHANRRWDDVRGWYLQLETDDRVLVSSSASLGAEFSFAVWLQPAATPTGGTSYSSILTVGGLVMVELADNAGSSVVRVSVSVAGAMMLIASSAINAEWTLLVVRRSDTTISMGLGTAASSVTWQVFSVDDLDELISADLVVSAGPRAFGIHDFVAWTSYKSNGDIETMRSPSFTKTEVAYPSTFVESLSRDNRYIFKLVAAGFAYPAKADVVTVRDVPAYAERYDLKALFNGDVRFKQVGIGDGDEPQALYQLGLRGPEVEGFGNTLISGSYPPLPGYTNVGGTIGQILVVQSPFSAAGGTISFQAVGTTPWPKLVLTNPVQDRVYIQGSATNQIFKVYADDDGSGVVLKAEPVIRERGILETGTIPAHLDEPTDAVTLLAVPGKRLAVSISGTTYTPVQVVDLSQTITTPPFYLYRQTQVYVGALLDAFSRWENPNAFGTGLGIPALSADGELQFIVAESLPAGTFQVTFDVGNIGTVDDNFSGFSTIISVVSGAGTVLAQQSQSLLPAGVGVDPRGLSTFNLTISETVTGPWLMTVEWNNSLTVPRKGQKRQLAVYGFELRLIAPALYQVSLNPLTMTAVDISDDSTVRPGGLIGRVNSYGTIVRIDHEALTFQGESDWPFSNLLTSSTWRRRQTLRVLNPSLELDPVAPTAPVAMAVSIVAGQSYYNYGDTLNLSGDVSAGSNVQAYVWRFWDQSVETTLGNTVSKIISPGFGGSVTMTVVDAIGNASTAMTVIPINRPPSMMLSATQSVGIFPFITDVTAVVSDLESDSVDIRWFEDGTQIGAGSPFAYDVLGQSTLVAEATDARGGMTTRSIAFFGNQRQPPIVSPIIRDDIGRISLTNSMNFAVYAVDPNAGGPLTFVWAFWNNNTDGLFATGFDDEGNRIVDNTPDPHYTVTANSVDSSYNGPAFALSGLPGYLVTPATGIDGINSERPAGNYDFNTTVEIPSGTDLGGVTLIVEGTADDYADIYVNGTLAVAAGLVNVLGTTSINAGNATFVIGVNTVVFRVFNNVGATPSFLNIIQFYGTSSTIGVDSNVADSNVKFNQAQKALAGSPPGEKVVRVVVTDEAGLSTTVQTSITLVPNTPPTIVEIQTPASGALAGTQVRYGAKVTDVDLDTVSYTWDFTSPRVLQLLGGNVKYPTITPDDIGLTIEGVLTVADGNGGSASQALPSVAIADAFIGPIALKVVPGFYSTGFVQEILESNEENVEYFYSLDGTDINSVTDGQKYLGPFMMLPPEGLVGKTTLKVRGFKDSFAPTEQLVAVFEFYDPKSLQVSGDPVIGEGVTAIVTTQTNGDSTITTQTGSGIPGDTGATSTSALQDTVPEVGFAGEAALPFAPIPTSTVLNAGEIESGDHVFVKLIKPI